MSTFYQRGYKGGEVKAEQVGNIRINIRSQSNTSNDISPNINSISISKRCSVSPSSVPMVDENVVSGTGIVIRSSANIYNCRRNGKVSRGRKKSEKVKRMDDGHNKRLYSMLGGYSNGLRTLLSSDHYFRKLRLFKQHLPKLSIIPIAVLSSTIISSITSKVYAQSTEFEFKKLPEGYVEELTRGSLAYQTPDSPINAISNVFNTISSIIEWFKHMPENITSLTTGITSDIFSLITSLILKTPLWIFDNEWFGNTTYLFTLISVGVVSVLTIIEGIKRKLRKKSVDLKTIAKRWFIVAGLSTAVPLLFHQAFKLLNHIFETIVGMSAYHIGNPIKDTLAMFDLLVLAAFNITLLILTVPILLKNARRFFDILVLALISPLAGVAYIFDSYKHLFSQWWSNLKQLSMVQVVYAFYLMIIGLFIYGVPTPDDVVGIGIKLLLVIGGFMRLINPPVFIQRQLDSGGTIVDSMRNDFNKSKKTISQAMVTTVQTIRNPINAIKFLSNSGKSTSFNPSTRMGRNHGK